MQQKITLIAGKEYRQPLNSSKFTTFLILSTGAAESLEFVQFESKGQTLERLNNVTKGLKVRSAIGFDAILFLSAVDADVQIVTSPADISVSQVDGATVNANVTAWPAQTLNVSNDRGGEANPVHAVITGLVATAKTAAEVLNKSQLIITDAVQQICNASTNRLGLRIANRGANLIAIGGPGLTWDAAAVVLKPDDVWREDVGQNLAWYAVTQNGQISTCGWQEINDTAGSSSGGGSGAPAPSPAPTPAPSPAPTPAPSPAPTPAPSPAPPVPIISDTFQALSQRADLQGRMTDQGYLWHQLTYQRSSPYWLSVASDSMAFDGVYLNLNQGSGSGFGDIRVEHDLPENYRIDITFNMYTPQDISQSNRGGITIIGAINAWYLEGDIFYDGDDYCDVRILPHWDYPSGSGKCIVEVGSQGSRINNVTTQNDLMLLADGEHTMSMTVIGHNASVYVDSVLLTEFTIKVRAEEYPSRCGFAVETDTLGNPIATVTDFRVFELQ